MVFVFPDINGGMNTSGNLVCGEEEKSCNWKWGGCLNCTFKMFSLPPGRKACIFGNQEAWRIAFVRQPYGRWGGGHCGAQPSSLWWVPFGPHVQFWQRAVHAFPFLNTFNMVSLSFSGTPGFFHPELRGGGRMQPVSSSVLPLPLPPGEVPVGLLQPQPASCWNVHVRISGWLGREGLSPWAVRCGSLIFSAVV